MLSRRSPEICRCRLYSLCGLIGSSSSILFIITEYTLSPVSASIRRTPAATPALGKNLKCHDICRILRHEYRRTTPWRSLPWKPHGPSRHTFRQRVPWPRSSLASSMRHDIRVTTGTCPAILLIDHILDLSAIPPVSWQEKCVKSNLVRSPS